MKPRISILNLLLVTTVVALVIVVLRVRAELQKERTLRIQLLQKGGILQVKDPDAVHVVQVSSRGEPHTLRWRIYVPEGRRIVLDARLEPVPADNPPAARLPPNAVVDADRNPANPMTLDAGESIITLRGNSDGTPYLKLEAIGSGGRKECLFSSRDVNFGWYYSDSHVNLTGLEHTVAEMNALRDGRSLTLADGKTFVLARFRELAWTRQIDGGPARSIREMLIWLQVDDG